MRDVLKLMGSESDGLEKFVSYYSTGFSLLYAT